MIFLFIVSQTEDTLTWYYARIAFFCRRTEYITSTVFKVKEVLNFTFALSCQSRFKITPPTPPLPHLVQHNFICRVQIQATLFPISSSEVHATMQYELAVSVASKQYWFQEISSSCLVLLPVQLTNHGKLGEKPSEKNRLIPYQIHNIANFYPTMQDQLTA
jgi:hypothetical protein